MFQSKAREATKASSPSNLFDVRAKHLGELAVFRDMLSIGEVGPQPTKADSAIANRDQSNKKPIQLEEDSETLAFIFSSLDLHKQTYWPHWPNVITIFQVIDKYDYRSAGSALAGMICERDFSLDQPPYKTLYAWGTHLRLRRPRTHTMRLAAFRGEPAKFSAVSDEELRLMGAEGYRAFVRFREIYMEMKDKEEAAVLSSFKAEVRGISHTFCMVDGWKSLLA